MGMQKILGGVLGYVGATLVARAIDKSLPAQSKWVGAGEIAGGLILLKFSPRPFIKSVGIGVALNGGMRIVNIDPVAWFMPAGKNIAPPDNLPGNQPNNQPPSPNNNPPAGGNDNTSPSYQNPLLSDNSGGDSNSISSTANGGNTYAAARMAPTGLKPTPANVTATSRVSKFSPQMQVAFKSA